MEETFLNENPQEYVAESTSIVPPASEASKDESEEPPIPTEEQPPPWKESPAKPDPPSYEENE